MATRGHFVFPIDAKNHRVLVIWDLNGYDEYEFDMCICDKVMACTSVGMRRRRRRRNQKHNITEIFKLAEISVLEPLEHSVPDVALVWGDCSLIKMTVSDPLEHSGLGKTDDVDLDSIWMAPWDACRTLITGSRPGMAIWRDVLCCVALLDYLVCRCFQLLAIWGLSEASEGHVFWT